MNWADSERSRHFVISIFMVGVNHEPFNAEHFTSALKRYTKYSSMNSCPQGPLKPRGRIRVFRDIRNGGD